MLAVVSNLKVTQLYEFWVVHADVSGKIVSPYMYLLDHSTSGLNILLISSNLKCFSSKLKLTYLREITVVKTS